MQWAPRIFILFLLVLLSIKFASSHEIKIRTRINSCVLEIKKDVFKIVWKRENKVLFRHCNIDGGFYYSEANTEIEFKVTNCLGHKLPDNFLSKVEYLQIYNEKIYYGNKEYIVENGDDCVIKDENFEKILGFFNDHYTRLN